MKTDVPAFNQLVKDQNIPAIVVKPWKRTVNARVLTLARVPENLRVDGQSAKEDTAGNMNSAVEVEHDEISVGHLPSLVAEKQRLEHTIEITWQVVQSTRRSALAATERLKGRPLSLEDQFGAIGWRDLNFLNSLYVDLEIVTSKIAFAKASQPTN